LTKWAHSSTRPESLGPSSAPVATENALAGTCLEVNPNLVGIGRSLRKDVAEANRPDDNFDEVKWHQAERGQFGTQRRQEFAVDAVALAQARKRSMRSLRSLPSGSGAGQEIRIRLDDTTETPRARSRLAGSRARRAGKPVLAPGNRWLCTLRTPLPSKSACTEIFAGFERHVTRSATRLGLGRVVESAGAMTRNAAQQVGIVMILTTQELFVVIPIPSAKLTL